MTADEIKRRGHSPDNRARFGYDFDYPESTAAPKLLKFLHSLFRDDGDREEKTSLLQEFLGACLLGMATTYQHTIVLKGDGENGKNALIDVVIAAFPDDAVCSIAPQHFESEYTRAMIAGKRLNVVSELPEAEIIASESFKAIVTGDPIHGRPIREAPFSFRPVAGHMFAANTLPGTNDQSHGFWRRFLVVTFNRNFADDPERDRHIAKKIIASEKPALVVWMLQGAQRLMRDGEYTIPGSHYEALATWKREADPVATFLEDCTRACAAGERGTPFADVYKRFVLWCQENGHRPMSSTKFGRRLKAMKLGSESHGEVRLVPVVMRGR